MRARLVVVLFPSIGKVSSLFDRCEVRALSSSSRILPLSDAIFAFWVGLPGFDEVQIDPPFRAPLQHSSTRKFRTVVKNARFEVDHAERQWSQSIASRSRRHPNRGRCCACLLMHSLSSVSPRLSGRFLLNSDRYGCATTAQARNLDRPLACNATTASWRCLGPSLF